MSAEERGVGERHCEAEGCAFSAPTPATPDAGDASEVEALAVNGDSYVMSVDLTTGALTWRAPDPSEAFCPHCNVGIAEYVAAREAAARAEERERIAQAIEDLSGNYPRKDRVARIVRGEVQ